MAMAISPSILKQATRIIREFLWQGRRDAKSGCCLVSWPRVCRPIGLGGPGVRDLHRFWPPMPRARGATFTFAASLRSKPSSGPLLPGFFAMARPAFSGRITGWTAVLSSISHPRLLHLYHGDADAAGSSARALTSALGSATSAVLWVPKPLSSTWSFGAGFPRRTKPYNTFLLAA